MFNDASMPVKKHKIAPDENLRSDETVTFVTNSVFD